MRGRGTGGRPPTGVREKCPGRLANGNPLMKRASTAGASQAGGGTRAQLHPESRCLMFVNWLRRRPRAAKSEASGRTGHKRFRPQAEMLEGRLAPATFIVNRTDDAFLGLGGPCPADGRGDCTLRAAILGANSTPEADTIRFNIPGTGVHTIRPREALPSLLGNTFIDGQTQPGF